MMTPISWDQGSKLYDWRVVIKKDVFQTFEEYRNREAEIPLFVMTAPWTSLDAKISLLSVTAYLIAARHKQPNPIAPHAIHRTRQMPTLLERNETRRVGGTDTRSSVLDRVAAIILASIYLPHKQSKLTKKSRILPNNVQPSQV